MQSTSKPVDRIECYDAEMLFHAPDCTSHDGLTATCKAKESMVPVSVQLVENSWKQVIEFLSYLSSKAWNRNDMKVMNISIFLALQAD